MYNLTIDDIHTYYVVAGETPVLVHNSNCVPWITGKLPTAEESALSDILAHIDAGTIPTGPTAKNRAHNSRTGVVIFPVTKGANSPYQEYRVAPAPGTSGAGPLRVARKLAAENWNANPRPYIWTKPPTRSGARDHQMCAAHLIRDLEDCAEVPGRPVAPATPAGVARLDPCRQPRPPPRQGHYRGRDAGAVHADVPRRGRGRLVGGKARAGGGQDRHPAGRPGAAGGVTRPRRRCPAFAHDLRIPPTNNQAERDLRPAEAQQKISGRLRSEQGTRHRCAIRGYLSTVIKYGLDVMTVLRDTLLGNLWVPPGQVLTCRPAVAMHAGGASLTGRPGLPEKAGT
ncbi:IS66 family transposase [Nonomuraea sp. CA-141351]|uniref:IS66 family transposase n=1 Tax=Nonomuraea sp. CA-141351 TaxID=3239996 RepID=UPI003D948FC1